MIHKLVVTDGSAVVNFPKTRRISHSGTLEGEETVMSDGTEVFDAIGFRKSVTYGYDWLPQSVFDVLIPMLRNTKYLTVTYLDLDNEEKTGLFSIEYPTAEAFKLTDSGGAVWHNVTLSMRAREVEVRDN